jgi:hypothetical protein
MPAAIMMSVIPSIVITVMAGTVSISIVTDAKADSLGARNCRGG